MAGRRSDGVQCLPLAADWRRSMHWGKESEAEEAGIYDDAKEVLDSGRGWSHGYFLLGFLAVLYSTPHPRLPLLPPPLPPGHAAGAFALQIARSRRGVARAYFVLAWCHTACMSNTSHSPGHALRWSPLPQFLIAVWLFTDCAFGSKPPVPFAGFNCRSSASLPRTRAISHAAASSLTATKSSPLPAT